MVALPLILKEMQDISLYQSSDPSYIWSRLRQHLHECGYCHPSVGMTVWSRLLLKPGQFENYHKWSILKTIYGFICCCLNGKTTSIWMKNFTKLVSWWPLHLSVISAWEQDWHDLNISKIVLCKPFQTTLILMLFRNHETVSMRNCIHVQM